MKRIIIGWVICVPLVAIYIYVRITGVPFLISDPWTWAYTGILPTASDVLYLIPFVLLQATSLLLVYFGMKARGYLKDWDGNKQ